jgi:hypothetical protein
METKKEKMERFLHNICVVPGWNGIYSKEDVEYFFERFSDIHFCNGHLRRVEVKPITDNIFKMYTVSAV